MNNITLRPIVLSDASRYSGLRSNQETYHWFHSQQRFTAVEVRRWLSRLNRTRDEVHMLQADAEVIGTCSLYNIDKVQKSAEVGRIIVDPQYRGQGVGTKMLELITDRATKLGLEQLYASIKKENIASQKAFEKAGYILNVDRTTAVKKL